MLKFKTSCAVLAYLSSNLLNEVGLSLFWYFEVGLRVCDIVVKKFTFAISSPDEFLLYHCNARRWWDHVCSFYPHDAMLARVLALIVCLSVRLSVTCRYCVKTAKRRIRKQRHPRDSPGTLVFWRQQSLVGDAPLPLKCALRVTHSPFEHNDFYQYPLIVPWELAKKVRLALIGRRPRAF